MAGEAAEAAGREVEIGGPEVTTYRGMMEEMARAIGRRPPLQIPVPLLTTRLSSRWVGLGTARAEVQIAGSAKARARSSSTLPVSWISKRSALITPPAIRPRLTR